MGTANAHNVIRATHKSFDETKFTKTIFQLIRNKKISEIIEKRG